MFKQYAERKGLQEKSLSFVADGKAISKEAMPMDLKKTDKRTVDDPECTGCIFCFE